jgi:hypothetical protein
VDYSNENAVLVRIPRVGRETRPILLCLDTRTSAFALAASVSSRSHVHRAERPLKLTHSIQSHKTSSGAAHP